MAGMMIVAAATIVALLIVTLGFLIAAHRRSEASRERQIEQRLDQLRGEGGTVAAP
jgi:hypothetical protein